MSFHELLRELQGVEFVLVGSTAMRLRGLDVEPEDVDIVPETSPGNLRALLDALHALGAAPRPIDGRWVEVGGELRWIEERPHDVPVDPGDVSTFDRRFVAPFGSIDVTPRIGGGYADLSRFAETIECDGLGVRVAALPDLLAGSSVGRREKDRGRVVELRQLERGARSVHRGGRPRGG